MSTENKPRGRNQHVFTQEDINHSTTDVRSVLSRIFRKLVHTCGRNPLIRWNELMDLHVKEVGKSTPMTPKNIGYTRGNTKSELTNDKMSWLVFCKGMRFLRFQKFRIIIIATDEQGVEYFTDDTVNIANSYGAEDDEIFVPDAGEIPKEQSSQWLAELIESNRHKPK